MAFDDKMKTVLITGVRGGIGSAVVAHFNKNGYRVFGLDYLDAPSDWVDASLISAGSLEDSAHAFSDSNNLFYVKTDLTKEDSVKKAYAVVSKCMEIINGSAEMKGEDVVVSKSFKIINENGKEERNDTIPNSQKTLVNKGICDDTISNSQKMVDGNGISDNKECHDSMFLDGIIHAAGKYDLNSLVEMPEKDFVGIFEINVFAIYRVNKAFIGLLGKGSRIVITASELAPLDPLPFTGIYGITKTTIEKYCHSLRMELQLLGIKVIELRPGAVRTGLLDHSMNRIDSFVNETELYKYSGQNFKKIATSVESKSITPETLAEFIFKVFNKRNPKFIYNINRNPLLLLLNALPDRFQTWVIKQILIH